MDTSKASIIDVACVTGVDHPAVGTAQEHVTGPEWWTDYQSVSYILTSKRGTREQLQNMINTCHAAGVGVIVGSYTIQRTNHVTAR